MLVRGLGKEIILVWEKTYCVCMCITHKGSKRQGNGGRTVIVFTLLNSCHRERNAVFFSKATPNVIICWVNQFLPIYTEQFYNSQNCSSMD